MIIHSKTLKAILSSAAALVFVASFLCGGAFAASNGGSVHLASVPAGYTAVTTYDQLYAIRNNLSGKYILMHDIDLPSATSWKPIGSYSIDGYGSFFSGTLDGNGYTIRNLKISGSYEASGLFSYVKGGTVKNLTFENTQVLGTTVSDCFFFGSVAGCAENAEIENCHNKSDITNTASGAYNAVGGIVGAAMGNAWADIRCEFVNCSNTGKIVSNGTFAGGITAAAYYSVFESCNNAGAVLLSPKITAAYQDCAGGIIGYGEDIVGITDCKNSGNIILSGGRSFEIAGGIFGMCEPVASVSNCVNVGNITVETDAGAIVGGIFGGGEIYSLNSCLNEGAVAVAASVFEAGGAFGAVTANMMSVCANRGSVTVSYDDDDTVGMFGGLSGYMSCIEDEYIEVSDCYNSGDVCLTTTGGEVTAGGLAGGIGDTMSFKNCYNAGGFRLAESSETVNALFGTIDEEAYNDITVKNCYYLNNSAQPYPDVEDVESDNVRSLTDSEMKNKISFTGFDFSYIWSISNTKPYKYPTLRVLDGIEHPACKVHFENDSFAMNYKSTTQLVPVTEDGSALESPVWTSSDESVVTVDENGTVTARAVGSATITVMTVDGSYSAACAVTVKMAWWQWLIKILLFGWIWY